MVPAYFYPSTGSDWDRLTAAASRVPLVAIMNPANGPGNSPTADPRYLRAIQSLQQAGGRVTGYVYTSYGKRSPQEVKADLRHYHELYPLDGFFLDEMANDGTSASVTYYAELYDYIHRLKPSYHVTGNPGTRTREIYLSRPTVDTMVTFEDGTGYTPYVPEAWNARYPSHQFCHLLHSITNAAGLTNAVSLAQKRNAGFLFVTDDVLPNPWDHLPTYWDAQIDLVEEANRAAAGSSPPRLDLKRREDGHGRLELDGPAGRYIIETAPVLTEWSLLTTNLTFTGQLAFEPILWAQTARIFFRAGVE
ncbi:MAG TPA: spherulation-specific family 4 protein [Verrucomicrobiota bacterium]|nr:spherulation-specific family 4 protein [Verrucomicrobiota bacterium]